MVPRILTRQLKLPAADEGKPAVLLPFGTIVNCKELTAVAATTNAVFMNSQRDGADFRLEVVPPDIYVRRVTVTREP